MDKETNEFSLLYLTRIVQQYLWYIMGVVGVAAIIAIVMTLPAIYPPEYLSSTVIYPTNSERFDLVNLFAEEPNVYVYGGPKEVEKLSNIAGSRELQLQVIDSLALWDAYGVDPENDASPEFYALRTFNGYVSAIQVSGNGLEISAYDTKPKRAAEIVNLMVHLIDKKNQDMLFQNQVSILSVYRETEAGLIAEINALADSSSKIRKKFNVFDADKQTEVLVGEVLQAQTSLAGEEARLRYMQNNTRGAAESQEAAARIQSLKSQLRTLVDNRANSPINLEKFRVGLDKIRVLEEIYVRASEDLRRVQQKIKYLNMMAESSYSSIIVIEKAAPSDKKARPIRWVILLGTLIIASVVSILGVVFVDQIINRFKE
ncbi:MAG: Wzz/FepE/Etk N-terminal domain-containing protein [Bacteroidota bacterium]